MANARAKLEVTGEYVDQLRAKMGASVDAMRERIDRMSNSLTRALNIAKTWAAIKLTGKFVDFLEKYSTGETQSRLVGSQQALEETFSKLRENFANALAPSVAELTDSLREIAEDIGPTLVRVFGVLGEMLSGWVKMVQQGFGLIRNWFLQLAEDSHFKFLPKGKTEAIERMTGQWTERLMEQDAALGEGPIAQPDRFDPEKHSRYMQTIALRARRAAEVDFASGHIEASFLRQPERYGSRERKKFNLEASLLDRWTVDVERINQGIFRLVTGFEDGLVGALTSVITKTKDAREAFAEFAAAIYQEVVRLLVQTGVRGFFGGLLSSIGGGVQGAGIQGGGGGGGIYIENLHAIDVQSFAQAAVRSQEATGFHTALTMAGTQRDATLRQRLGIRRGR